MALMETYLGAVLAAVTASILGVVSWAWQLSQRVAVLETHYLAEIATARRLEEKVEKLDAKLDALHHLLLRARLPIGERE